MSKQWSAKKSDFEFSTDFNKWYSEKKYGELSNMLSEMEPRYGQASITLKRKVMEEVANIIENNKTFSIIKVRTTFNTDNTILKIDIIYDSEEYYDPVAFGITNVIGCVHKVFDDYKRKIDSPKIQGQTNISIDFKFNTKGGVDV